MPASPGSTGRPTKRRFGAQAIALWLFLAAPLLIFGGMSVFPVGVDEAKAVSLPMETVREQKREVVALTEGKSRALLAKGDGAKERNATIAFSSQPVETMRGFVAANVPANAQRCLTQAIYYEAGFEPEDGKRAVAQVVLNRVRHPAYPNSVCGVVYEGSNQRVCQFSFTCDGALSRPPAAGAWASANRIAREALAGRVEKSVGSATHYHADYVVPRWAYSLGKVRQLGSHIFYRFNGGLGSARAFSALYSGSESIPSVRMADTPTSGGPDPQTGRYENGLTVAPDVKDRHASSDIGGRLDTTKEWRLELPKAGRYKQLVAAHGDAKAPAKAEPAKTATATAAPGFGDLLTEDAEPGA
ncbi:cell wall hydrolase [Croceicoccus naphthovorans]|uniref:cell wall hydrolase n=1 Tax=Croceicoccus naphthovorans TaxID=1348774 RepID=UPI000A3DA889|nr:cell wall hydrolase [Croceicoccus naphthovorans]MBB3990565.1 spore germination cell wall hydrolase CwlJ-like protein [Croceicoccus naphthovorans]